MNRWKKTLWCLALTIVVATLAAGAHASTRPDWRVPSEPTVSSGVAVDPGDPPTLDAGPSQKTITPVFAPIPFKNTQTGWGLMLMGMAIHRFDADTTVGPSTGVIGGFYTENKSWGVMALESARLSHDTWRLRGGLSHMDVRYKFYGIGEDAGSAGRSVDLEQTISFGMGTALYRIVPYSYLGGALLWMRTDARLDQDALPPELDVAERDFGDVNLFAPGIQGERDTRNDDYWPTKGSIVKAKGWFYTSALGGSRDFQRYVVGWSQYAKLAERVTLAGNASALAATGDVPFYMLPSVGAGEFGLRGYTQGRYRDKLATTVQAEVRWHSTGRLGATIFGGFAQVAPSVGELTEAQVLPGGGAGVRFQLTNEYPMHMRVDYAWGRSENLLYFSVGEAF